MHRPLEARSAASGRGLGFGVEGLGFRVWGLGFGVWGLFSNQQLLATLVVAHLLYKHPSRISQNPS